MELPLSLVIAGFCLVVMLVIIGGVIAATQRRQAQVESARQAAAHELGFEPVTEMDLAVREEILDVLRPGDVHELVWRGAYRRQEGRTDLYLPEFSRNDEDQSSAISFEENAVVAVSPDFFLPRFILMPQLDLAGRAGELVEDLTRGLMSEMFRSQLGMRPVKISERPDFDQRFLLVSEDEDWARTLFSGTLLSRLMSLRTIALIGRGRVLAVAYFDPTRRQTTTTRENLIAAVRAASGLLGDFESRGSG